MAWLTFKLDYMPNDFIPKKKKIFLVGGIFNQRILIRFTRQMIYTIWPVVKNC